MQSPNPPKVSVLFVHPNTSSLENIFMTVNEILGNSRKLFAEIYVEK